MAEMLGHSQTKERATGNPNLSLHHRATSRLYKLADNRLGDDRQQTQPLCEHWTWVCRLTLCRLLSAGLRQPPQPIGP